MIPTHMAAQIAALDTIQAVELTGEELSGLRRHALVSDPLGGAVFIQAFQRLKAQALQFKQQHGDLIGWQPGKGGASAQAIYRQGHREQARIARETREKAKAAGYRPHYATHCEVHSMMKTAHDNAFQMDRPSGRDILRRISGKPDGWAEKVAGKQARKALRRSLQELTGHPTAQALRAQGVLTARDKQQVADSTLAGAVAALYSRADIAARLASLERRAAAAEAKADAALAAAERAHSRLDVVESGEHWHGVAERMRAAGASYGAIAKATGQKADTVKKAIRRL